MGRAGGSVGGPYHTLERSCDAKSPVFKEGTHAIGRSPRPPRPPRVIGYVPPLDFFQIYHRALQWPHDPCNTPVLT
jgi:hypothetical protein